MKSSWKRDCEYLNTPSYKRLDQDEIIDSALEAEPSEAQVGSLALAIDYADPGNGGDIKKAFPIRGGFR